MSTDPVHIHLEIPQDVADQFPEGETFACRLVRTDDGTAEICVTPLPEKAERPS